MSSDAADLPPQTPASDLKEMSFVEHLTDLRRALIFSVLGLIVGAGLGFYFHKPLLELLMAQAGHVNFVIVAPAEGFMAVMRLSILLGLFLGLPIAMRELFWFVGPALNVRQRLVMIPITIISYLLFVTGTLFAYFVLLPIGVKFLIGFTPAGIQPMLSIDRYIGFASLLIFSTGLIFQVPIVMLLLSFFGLLQRAQLSLRRKHAVLICFVIGAVLTPADVMSQIMLASTLIVLFEIGLLLMWGVERLRGTRPVESE